MNNNMIRITISLLLVALVGCSQSVDIQLEPEITVFEQFDSKQQIRLTPGDEEYVVLNEWLNDNKTDWLVTSGRYTGGVYVQSGNYGIQVTDRYVVIYMTAGTKPRAKYIQNIKQGELSRIKNIGK